MTTPLHAQGAPAASCNPQERLHQQLLASDFLTATERDVLRWGRNATGGLEPKHSVVWGGPCAARTAHLFRLQSTAETATPCCSCCCPAPGRRDTKATVRHGAEA